MARIIGGVTSSHIPAVGNAIANNQTREPYWKRFFDGYEPAKAWLREKNPDVVIVVYNDHGLNFFLDKVPTFALGCADVYNNADEGWALKPVAPFKGDAQLSWHIAESLVNQEFDVCTCQEMKVDHGFVNPMRALFGTHEAWPVTAIPLAVNTVQHPVPTALRCYKLGHALRRAVESYPDDLKVVVFGTGGLSHQLQGERAGLIDVDFDLDCIHKIANDPEWLTQFSNSQIMRRAGTEGIETIMWLVMRGALQSNVKVVHKHYHAPISNTGAGVLVLENYA
jgi:protocatechuate 4,5-dioxygenase beta chain